MDASLREELADVEDRHWWYEGRRRILDAVLAGLDLPTSADLLEVGCGSGANLSTLARHGRVWACEPDDADRDRAESRGVATVEAGDLPANLPFAGRTFDVVALLDVLEHVPEDVASLRALGSRLAPDGRLVLTVPAHPRLWSEHDERNGHVRRYRRAELTDRLGRAGLVTERMTWFNTWLAPIVAAVRTLGSGSAGIGVPPAPLNRVLTAVFASEARILRNGSLPAGISLLAVARRGGTPPERSRTDDRFVP